MNSKTLIALAVAGSLAAGCSKTGGTSQTPPPPAGEKTGDTYALGDCASIGAPAPTLPAYTVTIGKSFDIRNPVVVHGGHAQGTRPGNHKHPTPLDVTTQVSGVQSALIQISIQTQPDPELDFMDLPRALRGATSNAPQVFCGATITTVNGLPTLSFTFFPVGSDTSAAVNIGLLAGKMGAQLPVIIDPWSDNNGIVARK